MCPEPDLPRRIGWWGGCALMVGNIIGSGIFQAPVSVAQELGSPALILALWVVGGFLSLCGALTYAELATALPRSGGMYVYLYAGLGERVAFVFGWTYLLLIKPFAAAAIALTFATHFDALLGVAWSPPGVASAMLVALTALNTFTLRGSSALAILLTGLKVLALAAIVGLGAALLKGSGSNFTASPAPRPLWLALAPAMYGILWTYDGWADIASIAGEIEEPHRNLPRILVWGTGATVLLYVAVNAVYCSLVPLSEMRTLSTVAPLVLERLLGKAGAVVVTGMIVLSTAGATHGAILTGARVTFAQARDGLLFRVLGRVHPAARTPDVSLWVQAALSCGAIAYLRRFKDLSEGYGFTMWIFYALSAAAVILLRRRRPDLERPYRCWGYPWVPGLFMIASVGMTVLYVAANLRGTLPWIGVLALGVPAYSLWKGVRRDPQVDPPPAAGP